MRISTILDHIDSGHMALPEFQRGYVWNRDQVRGLFDSMYKRHPVGGLLVWATQADKAAARGDGIVAPGVVKLLLDGQQRITSLYGVARGRPPKFFDGNERAFTGLMFHVGEETFEFYQPVKMREDPLWVDVSELMKGGSDGLEETIERISQHPDVGMKAMRFAGRLTRVLGVLDVDLHIEEVTGDDKSLDVVVDIFNRVNSGGTKLSKGDLALAKICADWPDARDVMKSKLKEWESAGYSFNLDWLLRSVNTVLTGEAKFQYLHNKSAEEVQEALKRANRQIDNCLNMIAGRLGLDHDRVIFGRFAIPVMVRYLDVKGGRLSESERDRLLFWFAQAGMWGRYSGSTETYIDKDLEALEGAAAAPDQLINQLRLWHGTLRVQPDHFTGWSLGARFYPVLYMITRMGQARDWGTGLELRANLLGKMSALEVHHIFPKSRLYKHDYARSEVNALANFCFLTKDTNLDISNRLPEDYFPEIEENHPGALASQWIPMDPELWRVSRFRDFLEARKALLAAQVNLRMEELLHGEKHWMDEGGPTQVVPSNTVGGGITSEEEERELDAINHWVVEHGLCAGTMSFDYSDPATGEQRAIFDLAWPHGLQSELTQPVALLLNEGPEVLAVAMEAGYRPFTSVEIFRKHVRELVLADGDD